LGSKGSGRAWSVGEKLYFARKYDEALGEIDKALKLSPDFLPA